MEPEEIARACYEAFANSDREAAEALIAESFRFTSPLDNGIDREAWFELCWPAAQNVQSYVFDLVAREGERVFVIYVCHLKDGRRLRNAEALRVVDGKLTEAEVYFGWRLPHDAPEGRHMERAWA